MAKIWLKLFNNIKDNIIRKVAGDKKYCKKAYILFQILGYIVSHKSDVEFTREATEDSFKYIVDIFNQAQNYEQFRLTSKCISNYIGKLKSTNDEMVSSYFLKLQEVLVIKVIPNFDLDQSDNPNSWALTLVSQNNEQQQWFIHLRKLIMESYTEMMRKVPHYVSVNLFKVSFPIIASYINDPYDVFTGEPVTVENLRYMLTAICTSLEKHDGAIITRISAILHRTMEWVAKHYNCVKDEKQHSKSDAMTTVADLVDYFYR